MKHIKALSVALCLGFFLSSAPVNAKGQKKIQDLNQRLKKEPNDHKARLALIEHLLDTAKISAAKAELKKAQTMGLPKTLWQPLLGQVLMSERKYQALLEQVPVIENISTPAPTRIAVLMLRAEAFTALGKKKEAKELLKKARQLDKTNGKIKLGLAKIAISEQSDKEALSLLEAATDLSTDADIEKHQLLANLYKKNNQCQKARESLEKIVELDKYNADSYLELVSILYKGKDKNFNIIAKDLFELKPHDPKSMYYYAISLIHPYDTQSNAQAKSLLQKVIELEPALSPLKNEAQYELAEIYYKEQKLEQATSLLKTLSSNHHLENALSFKVINLLASVSLKQDKPEVAIQLLEPVVSKKGADLKVDALLGAAYLRTGQVAKGKKLLESAAQFETSQALSSANQLQANEITSEQKDIHNANYSITNILFEKITNDSFQPLEKSIVLAYNALEKGDLDEAENIARVLVENKPSSISHNLLGLVLAAKGDNRNAITHYVAANQKDPKFIPSHLNLCDIYLEQNRIEKAEITVRKVLAINPASIRAHHILASISLKKGHKEESIQLYRKAMENNPDSSEPGLALIDYYLKEMNSELNSGNDKSSEVRTKHTQEVILTLADDLYKKFPTNIKVLEINAKLNLDFENFDKANSFYEQLYAINKDEIKWQLGLAKAKLGLGDKPSAMLLLDTMLNKQENVSTLTLLMPLVLEEKDYAKAEYLALKLQTKMPSNAMVEKWLGDSYLGQSKLENAIDAYQKSLILNPEKMTLLALYNALLLKSDNENALLVLSQWLKHNPDDLQLKEILAKAFVQNDKNDLAVELFEEIISSHPQHWEAMNQLASLYLESDTDKALNYANIAHGINPNHPSVLDTLGWVLINQNKPIEGVTYIKAALKADKDSLEYQYHLAVGLYRTGQITVAKQTLALLLSKDTPFRGKNAAIDLYKGIKS